MKRKFKTYAAYYNAVYGRWQVLVADSPKEGDPLSFIDYEDYVASEEAAKGIAMFKTWEQRQADYEDPEGTND
jgi:hypothetical protein